MITARRQVLSKHHLRMVLKNYAGIRTELLLEGPAVTIKRLPLLSDFERLPRNYGKGTQ
jgi:hypothetical protein